MYLGLTLSLARVTVHPLIVLFADENLRPRTQAEGDISLAGTAENLYFFFNSVFITAAPTFKNPITRPRSRQSEPLLTTGTGLPS